MMPFNKSGTGPRLDFQDSDPTRTGAFIHMASSEQSESITDEENKPTGIDKTKMLKQIGASVFFGVTSCVIVLVNKIVLTSYE